MLKVYTDASVISGCFNPEFERYGLALLEEFKTGTKRLFFSDVMVDELPEAGQVKIFEVPDQFKTRLNLTSEAHRLADAYIQQGALTQKHKNIALHIALATIHQADVLVSWDFTYVANLERIKLYNTVSINLGYQPVEIYSPESITTPLYEGKPKAYDAVKEARKIREQLSLEYYQNPAAFMKAVKEAGERFDRMLNKSS
jgi:hypothetical protein